MYAYVYTGDGATAKNNAAWPGVEMTAMAAADSCAKPAHTSMRFRIWARAPIA